MRRQIAFSLISCMVILGMVAGPVLADGIIIPDPPRCPDASCPIEPFPIAQLQIKYHYVDVTIGNQVATTHVDQVFYNPSDLTVEGIYIFPLPVDAVVTNFTLWVDGNPVEGKVLSADEARRVYEEIVNRQRDPALLEYIGRGAVQASIFPIPPQGERRIELSYSQVLTAENGLVRYVYPLNTEKFSIKPLDSVRVTVNIKSEQPIRAVYSPSHPVGIDRIDEKEVIASYEDGNVLPDTDFALYYSIGESEAFHLMTYRDPGDPVDADGFFLMLLAPGPNQTAQVIAKDVILVLDHSGSMEGEKFLQTQEAARFILNHLNPEDHFGLVSFSSGVESYSSGLRPIDEVDQALGWIDGLSALGSTDINRALLEAASMVSGERPAYLIFLTDGLPTEGETDSQNILNNLALAASKDLRLFSFGVGYDVDTFLLDSLAQEHNGRSTYVRPGEKPGEILFAFYAGINTPVLTDLSLDFSGLSTYDLYPDPLPDLFEGSQIVVVGRYRQGGMFDVTLSGIVINEKREFFYQAQVFAADTRLDADQASITIPRLWATRKIGYLLNRIRLDGPDQEMIDQVVRLSIRYGIVTPYTAYLVTEEMILGATAQESLAENTFRDMVALPTAATSGQVAVDKAAVQGELERSDSAMQIDDTTRSKVRVSGSHTFVLMDGVWVDTSYDPEKMETQKVPFLSDDYFGLSRMRKDIASGFALGEHVIVVSDGVAYEVVGEDVMTEPLQKTPDPLVTSETQNITTPNITPVSSPGRSPYCSAILLPLFMAAGVMLRKKLIERHS
jgi:Ca-activated chloride channel family protein